jgi:hypothetical protein
MRRTKFINTKEPRVPFLNTLIGRYSQTEINGKPKIFYVPSEDFTQYEQDREDSALCVVGFYESERNEKQGYWIPQLISAENLNKAVKVFIDEDLKKLNSYDAKNGKVKTFWTHDNNSQKT